MTSNGSEMPSGRRRGKLPGMTPPAPAPARTLSAARESNEASSKASEVQSANRNGPASSEAAPPAARITDEEQIDYSATRLVNFRLPVQLHDRYKRLLRELQDSDPRLRKPNLTELVVHLLEEGPRTATEAGAAIRAQRAAQLDPS